MKSFVAISFLVFGTVLLYAEDITTTDGKKYVGVTISRAEPDGLVVMTDSGIEKIPFAVLSKELQTKYGYDPQKAAKYSAAVQAATARHQAATNAALAAAQKQAREANAQAALSDFKFEKPERGHIGTPGVHILLVAGNVLQVLPDGVLLASGWENRTLEPYGNNWGATVMSEPLFILGNASGLVDGDSFSGVVYPAGTYSYKAVIGTGKTVRCYAVEPKVAAQRRMAK